ncbi:hypothetical protein ACFU8W_24215 [Streptomyces sp. NPDC057565]|uniref:hypothetical protein n=1 Tax=Streptomyces sp. NPDC057565 TaxID=3346169 RepID=UPI0036AE16D0
MQPYPKPSASENQPAILDRPGQPRTTPEFAPLKELYPDAEVLRVRADPHDLNRAEVLAAYLRPKHEGEPLRPLDGPFPDDRTHTALTIAEFLTSSRYSPAVRAVGLTETAHTYLIELWRPHWEV